MGHSWKFKTQKLFLTSDPQYTKFEPIHHLRLTLQVVVVGVLSHTTVKECPCQVVHSILLVLHSFGDNLSIEVVMEAVVQM